MERLDIDIVLERRSFDLRACLSVGPETVTLVGPSGAGKTSLLRSIAGLERPRAGRISLGDEIWFDAVGKRNLRAEHRHVGYLPQDYGLFPHLTVAGNVAFAARRERPDVLQRLGIAHLSEVKPRDLSGGERQRVALARAVAREPRVLLLDEPFGALDAITRRRVRDELADLLATLRLPSLLVTHAFEDAVVLSHRVGVLDRGQLVQLGSPEELVQQPASALVAELTGANVLAGTAVSTASGSVIALDGGGSVSSHTNAEGPVHVAIQPWELSLAAPGTAALTDRILDVHHDRGAVVLRLERLTVRVAAGANGAVPGQLLGLGVAPSCVRVFPQKTP